MFKNLVLNYLLVILVSTSISCEDGAVGLTGKGGTISQIWEQMFETGLLGFGRGKSLFFS
jgi:hypothetical protein